MTCVCVDAQWKTLLLANMLLSHMASSGRLSTILMTAGNTKLNAKAGHVTHVSPWTGVCDLAGQE